VFIGGGLFKLIWMIKLAKKDQIVFPRMGLRECVLSLFEWLLPYTRTNVKKRPVLVFATFVFHISLIVTPLFILSHNLLWQESWNIGWWCLPETIGDIMTAIVICSCLFFLVRRLVLAEVQMVTRASDYFLLLSILAPFLTGFLAYHQWFAYKPILMAHILSGEILLISIPFNRLTHMFLFFVAKAYIGSEFEISPRPAY
jgi:nitrate reductase gamma subunit